MRRWYYQSYSSLVRKKAKGKVLHEAKNCAALLATHPAYEIGRAEAKHLLAWGARICKRCGKMT